MLGRLIRAMLSLSLVIGVFTLGMIAAIWALQDYATLGQSVYREVVKCEIEYKRECRVDVTPKERFMRPEYRL